MALAERLTLWARWPAKSSVQSWFSGSKPFSSRYSAHFVSCGQYSPAKSAFPSTLAIAASSRSMLPVSSTGIWFCSVRSPPP